MISVLSAVAEIERENIRTQTMAGREQKAREGKWNGGFAPYGYKLENGNLVIAEDEVEVIRVIYDRYIHTNEGVTGVAKYLNRNGYAKTIKLTGRFPSRPKKMGEVKFEDFQNNAIRRWNISGDPQGESYAQLAETMLSKSNEEWNNSDMGRMLAALEMMKNTDLDLLLAEYVLPKVICKRKALGADHPEIQLMVKLIYENQNILGQAYGMEGEMTIKQFSRFYSSSYLAGDVAKLKAGEYSEEDCEFIAEALSIFGGYKNHDELVEEEMRYGRRDGGGEENE